MIHGVGFLLVLSIALFAFSQADAQTPAAITPRTPLSQGHVNWGLSLKRGNSESYDTTLGINHLRRWTLDEFNSSLDVSFGRTKDKTVTPPTKSVSDRMIKANAKYDRPISERWYTGGRLDFKHDYVASMDYQGIASPQLGYYSVRSERTTLSEEFGPAIVVEKRLKTKRDSYMALRLAERFDYLISSRSKLLQDIDWFTHLKEFKNWHLSFSSGITSEVTESLALQFKVMLTRDNLPGLRSNGTRMDKNNFRLVSGITLAL